MVQDVVATTVDIELDGRDADLSAQGTLVIEGPLGQLVVKTQWTPLPPQNGGTAERQEQVRYFHPDSTHASGPFTTRTTTWQPREAAMHDREAVRQACRGRLTNDPRHHYETTLRGARLGIDQALADAQRLVAASEGHIGLTEPQAEAYALRDLHNTRRKWAALALDKPPNTVDSLVQTARQKMTTIQELAAVIEES